MKHPITLSNFKEDVTTLFQIFFAKEYEIKLRRQPQFIIDCGANVGLSAVYFANRYPAATIVAIEPEERNFEYLELNAKHYPNVHCMLKAIWSHHGKVAISDPGKGSWGFQTTELNDERGKTVEGITIGEIMDQFQFRVIDLLKIDIEGAEKELFSGNYENWLSNTNTIAIELHDFLQPGTSENFYRATKPYDFQMWSQGENLICER